jgi:hypothetical protein
MIAFPIPIEAMDDRLAITGTPGSGKTYTAMGAVERLLAGSARCIIIDPLDVWWGLRLMADGVTPSNLRIPIFGGAHGDLPLTEQAGALIGETVATMRESCIVSLSTIGTKAGERRFMLAFLTALYKHAAGEPMHLVIDEADMFAPQMLREKEGEAAKLLGQMETIVRRGRVRGFIPWLITQRPAVLNKDILSMADGLIAMKLTSSQDRKAIDAWIEGQADQAERSAFRASLPTMQRGQGIVWIPARGILETVAFPAKTTFDSSRAPARGEVRRASSLKPLDLEGLRERLAGIADTIKANDPQVLRAEIAVLKADLAKAARNEPDSEAIAAADLAGYRRGYEAGYEAGQGLMITRINEAVQALRLTGPQGIDVASRPKDTAPIAKATRPQPEPQQPAKLADGLTSTEESLTGSEIRLLNAFAWWHALDSNLWPSNEQIAFIAGYSPTSGNFANLRSSLKTKGLVVYGSAGRTALTVEGMRLADMPTIPPSGHMLRERVLDKLKGPQAKVLDCLLKAWPEGIRNFELAEQSGYSVTSGNFANLRSSLRTIGCVEYPGTSVTRACDWLFPERT